MVTRNQFLKVIHNSSKTNNAKFTIGKKKLVKKTRAQRFENTRKKLQFEKNKTVEPIRKSEPQHRTSRWCQPDAQQL